ncbi:MAG: hypothetical protein ACKVPJ_04485 [Chitinophagales bacterium]
MIKKELYFFFFFAVVLIACDKEPIENEPNEIIGDVPYIELRSVSPTTVTEYVDSILFEIFYQDGNGDLGYESPDSMALFITDARIFTTEQYHIPMLTPAGTELTIQGILNVKLDRTIMIDDSNPSETVQFKVQIKDRAGNYSNIVTTQDITVLPD